MPSVKGAVRRVLRKLGIRTRGDFAGDCDLLLELPISEGIGLHHYGLGPTGFHPFVRAIQAGLVAGQDAESAIGASLQDYYAHVQPRSAADWLGLDPDEAPPSLIEAPPFAVTFPWQVQTPEEWRVARERGIPNENRTAGHDMPIEEGWHACGPVSARKAGVEAHRLARVLASMQEHGFQRHGGRDGDIDAVLLKGHGVQRWWINSGHHRAAVMSALGYTTAPVRIRRIVDLEKVSAWDNVASGLFTPATATKIVNRLLTEAPPRVAAAWIARLQGPQHQDRMSA